MDTKSKYLKYIQGIFVLSAMCIIGFILFQYPQPGVADQGDFDRVMNVSGLRLTSHDLNNPDFIRFFDYPVTEFEISPLTFDELLKRIGATSIAYLITLLSLIGRIMGQETFKTAYLAIAYSLMYISGLYVIIKYLNIKNPLLLSFILLLTLLVFLDGNYIVWFNSLYGEPMMITTLALYMAAWVYYIYKRYRIDSEEHIFLTVLIIFILAFLFLGSKMQVLSALPVLLLMLGKLTWENRQLFKRYQTALLSFGLLLFLIYPASLSYINKDITKDTQYNSVFYGILKNSADPAQDLIDMGLNPDMAVEAGKHAFFEKEKYVKYVPHTEITQEEFYNKISNGKLVKFYLTHPIRFLQGMELTADSAFVTSTFLGKYPRSYSETPVSEFDRFTWWSSFREKVFPHHFAFIVSVYLLILFISIISYPNASAEQKNLIILLWSLMAIGMLQFPMPYVGNGEADTGKQLFLFNYIFDFLVVVAAGWGLQKLLGFIGNIELGGNNHVILNKRIRRY